jgi:hypothetical protein
VDAVRPYELPDGAADRLTDKTGQNDSGLAWPLIMRMKKTKSNIYINVLSKSYRPIGLVYYRNVKSTQT